MTNQPPPDWRRPQGVAPGTWQYVNQRSIADHYDAFVADTPLCQLDHRIIQQALPGPPNRSEMVLDFGCGTGRTAIPLASSGYEVVGVDLSQPMLQQLIAKADSQIHTVKANLVDLNCFADNVADHAVCMFSTLGMIAGRKNRRRFLSHVRRVVRESGRFVFHVHHRWAAWHEPGGKQRLLKSWMRSLFTTEHEFGDAVYAYRGLDQMFMHRYSRRELLSDLKACGWEIEQLHLVAFDGADTVRSIRHTGGFIVIATTG